MPQAAYVRCNINVYVQESTNKQFQCRKRHMFVATCKKQTVLFIIVSMPQAAYVRCNSGTVERN